VDSRRRVPMHCSLRIGGGRTFFRTGVPYAACFSGMEPGAHAARTCNSSFEASWGKFGPALRGFKFHVEHTGPAARPLRGLDASAHHPIPQPRLPKRGKLGVQGGNDELHRLRTNFGDQAR